MLPTFLLLAQFVQSWPWLDSPLVQPGPTICVGACAGPVVWGPPERGRLVVACDMRSDTCSDGRKISTQRATPVPCETSPGVWEMVPENTGCYSVRGLESWAQNTSYLSWGAELDRSPWVGAAVPASQGYQITGPLSQSMAAVEVAEQRTTAWILRADTPRLVTIGVQPTGGCEVEVGTEWRTYSCTEQVAIGVSPEARITQPVGQSVYAIAAWHTRTATPGRPCWGGEAPVTCAGDRHSISTDGWPTESGEVCVSASIGQRRSTFPQYFFDGRETQSSPAARLFVSSTAGSPLILAYGLDQVAVSSSLSWDEGRSYKVCAQRDDGGVVSLLRDGVVVGSASAPAFPWLESVNLGSNYLWIETQYLNGSISSLRVRSFE